MAVSLFLFVIPAMGANIPRQTQGPFLPAFAQAATDAIDASTPADFHLLISSVAISSGGLCGTVNNESELSAFLDKVPFPAPEMKTNLAQEMPALLISKNGDPEIRYVRYNFNSGLDTAQVQIAIGGVQILAGADGAAVGFSVAVVFGVASGPTIQQYEQVCHNCCTRTCWLGNCKSWIHSCSGCCDNVPVQMTAAQLGDIKQGLQADVYSKWASTFPVSACGGPPTASASLLAQIALGEVQSRPHSVDNTVDSDFDKLRSRMQAFVNSAANQNRLHRKTKEATVNKMQLQMASISQSTNTIVIPDIWTTDVSRALELTVSSTVTRAAIMADMEDFFKHPGDDWFEAVDAHVAKDKNNATIFSYAAVWVYPISSSPGDEVSMLDMVVCTVQEQMQLENLDMAFTTRLLPNGTSITNVKTTVLPEGMTKADIQQFATQLRYLAADAVINALHKGVATSVLDLPVNPILHPLSRYMRVYEFRRSIHERDGWSGVNGLSESFEKLLKSAVATGEHLVSSSGGWIHKTSHTDKIISTGGYKQLTDHSTDLVIPQVATQDIPRMCELVLYSFPPEDIARAQNYITAMMISRSTQMNSSWYQLDTKFNASQLNHSGEAFGGIFTVHMSPNASATGYHNFNWVVYDTSFALADRLLMVTDSSSWLGGLFSSTSQHIEHLPPVWTGDDVTAFKVFLEATMYDIVCNALRSYQNPPPPPCVAPKMPNPDNSEEALPQMLRSSTILR